MPRVVIVGGGIAGLAAARARARGSGARGSSVRVDQVVAAERGGGQDINERVGGFLVEAGADSFGTRRPRPSRGQDGDPPEGALDLVEDLGLAGDVLPTPADRVLVLRRGHLEALPRGLQLVVPTDLKEVFRSRLLSLPGKLRVALELSRRPGSRRMRPGDAETVASFLRRHFGDEYTDRIAAPLLAGIHSADPERLSLSAAFPMLAGLEARYGSLIRGARRAATGGPSRVTLAGGMGTLVDALAKDLEEAGVAIRTGRRVKAIVSGDGRFRLDMAGDAALIADAVVLATPPAVSASVLSGDAAATLTDGLRAIPHASTATVSLGFGEGQVRHPLDALGFLVPPAEERALAACTFASSKFPDRAPEGAVLVRAYLGGGGGGELPEDDGALAALAVSELTGLLGITGEPRIARVHRYRNANPRYEPGHRERVAALEAAAPPGLALAGCSYHGVGIPDCLASGRRAAERVLEHLTERVLEHPGDRA